MTFFINFNRCCLIAGGEDMDLVSDEEANQTIQVDSNIVVD